MCAVARVFSEKGRGGRGKCFVVCALCRILKIFKLHRDFFAISSFLKLKIHGTFQNCKNSRHLSKVVPRTCSRVFSLCCAKKAVQQKGFDSTTRHTTQSARLNHSDRRLNRLLLLLLHTRTRIGFHGRNDSSHEKS